MHMKSYKSISVAILVALSLYPPWAAMQNCSAQSNTDTQTSTDADNQTNTDISDTQANTDTQTSPDAETSTNLYRARINLVCFTTNANGNIVHQRIITSEFIQECALGMGVTNFSDLALAYNRSNNSLQVVNRTNREVICTPLTFADGLSLANADNTRVLLQNFVFLNTDTVASGLLSATQRLTYASSGELRSFGMRGSLFYSFTDGTNSSTICQGGIAVGTSISQQGNRNRDLDDDNNNNNNGNQGQGNNRTNRNNLNTNNGNQGVGTTNMNTGFGTTNVNPRGFGITNNPVIVTNNAIPGFTSNQGFGTGVNQGFTANQGFGTGITGVNPAFGTGLNQTAGVNQSIGSGVNQ
jgi:hypothetical protein